jgi:hypothetical protein
MSSRTTTGLLLAVDDFLGASRCSTCFVFVCQPFDDGPGLEESLSPDLGSLFFFPLLIREKASFLSRDFFLGLENR